MSDLPHSTVTIEGADALEVMVRFMGPSRDRGRHKTWRFPRLVQGDTFTSNASPSMANWRGRRWTDRYHHSAYRVRGLVRMSGNRLWTYLPVIEPCADTIAFDVNWAEERGVK